MLWGASADAEQATLYQLPPEHDTFPPFDDPPEKDTPSTTKTHLKPTHFLSSDIPAAPTGTAGAVPSVSPTSTPTPDEGWFAGMGNLVSNQKWVFGAAAVVLLFGIGAGIFFWRRRRQARARYSSLPGEEGRGGGEMSMSGMGGSGGGTRELYDAFGEVSDDEEDENAPLQSHPDRPLSRHSQEGEDRYRDDPRTVEARETAASPAGSGSWVHASDS